ncbi:MAG: geranylgeranyl reductase family protein [Candidatus Micrarchaeaceae archaeon]
MENYDIIVAGAGVAGAVAAAAAAKGGARVLLIDRNDLETIGKKTNWGWVCGDAVAETHIDFVSKHLGVSFSEPELNLKVDGVYALSPDMKTKIMFEGAGYSLDRPRFAKKLLGIAIKNGAETLYMHEVEGPIIEDNAVVGVYGKDAEKKDFKVKAKIVIDALGIASTLRRKLPKNPYVEQQISTRDIELTGRYILKFEPDGSDDKFYDPKNAIIHLNQDLAPGGYGWVFPKKGKIVNIGVGVESEALSLRNRRLGRNDTLHSLIDAYVAWNPIIKNTELYNEYNNGKGYWSVAVRRQLDSLVFTGYMGAGDSMAMPNPISAGGIGPALTAGILAGEVAASAAADNDASIERLWQYNVLYNEVYGSKTAGLEAFRIYLQSLSNDLINYGMANFLTKDEAVQISYGMTPELTLAGALTKAIKGLANINAFKNLLYTVKKMKRLNELYKNYPKNITDFHKWKELVAAEIEDANSRFKRYG